MRMTSMGTASLNDACVTKSKKGLVSSSVTKLLDDCDKCRAFDEEEADAVAMFWDKFKLTHAADDAEAFKPRLSE